MQRTGRGYGVDIWLGCGRSFGRLLERGARGDGGVGAGGGRVCGWR